MCTLICICAHIWMCMYIYMYAHTYIRKNFMLFTALALNCVKFHMSIISTSVPITKRKIYICMKDKTQIL